MLNSKIMEKPIISERKVYIINDSQKMTIEAQNCLLKTLEEPPNYATIILICNNEAQLLTTIKSRCTKISFLGLSYNEIEKYIKSKTNESVNDSVLKLADGSIGKALILKDKEDLYSKVKSIIDNIEDMKKVYLWKNAELIYKSADDIQEILDYMNILLFEKAKENVNYLNCIEIVEETKRKLKVNSNYNMTIDKLLIQIWEEINEKHSRS